MAGEGSLMPLKQFICTGGHPMRREDFPATKGSSPWFPAVEWETQEFLFIFPTIRKQWNVGVNPPSV
jgi:hypothetical protein